MRLRRRTLLASFGTAVVSAGCLGTEDDSTNDGNTSGTDPTSTPTDTATETPTPSNSGRVADEPCPSFTDTDRTVCWHSRGGSDIYLEPSTEEFRPVNNNDTVETVTFTLHNDGDERFELNPYAWAVKYKQDGQWVHVAPDEYIEPLIELPPGETYEWVLSRHPYPTPESDRTLYPTAEVGSGLHAFVVDGWHGSESANDREHIECIALFDVALVVRN